MASKERSRLPDGTSRAARWLPLAASAAFMLLMLASLFYFRTAFFAHNGVMYRKRAAVYMLPSLLSVAAAAVHLMTGKRWKHGRIGIMLIGIVLGAAAFQQVTWNNPAVWTNAVYAALTISITAVIFMGVWALVWDARAAAVIAYWLLCVCGYAYECVYLFRGIAFKPADILSAGTALSVVSGYQFAFEARHLFWLSAGVLLWTLTCLIPARKPKSIKHKIGKAACIAAAFGWFWVLLSTPVLPGLGVATTAFENDANLVNGTQGTLTTLTMELYQLRSNMPEDYDAARLRASAPGLAKENDLQPLSSKPNLVVIMNESFSDLPMLWEIGVSPDPLSYFHSLAAQTLHGNLYVSAYGGETCNTEHSFLTGTAPAPLLGMPLLSTVRENTPSVVWQMKEYGYTTIAMHPHHPSNYQRDIIYPRLGFDTFISGDDFPDAVRWRNCVRDEDCYKRIISLFEQKSSDERLFLFNVTMQNHGGYLTGKVDRQVALSAQEEDPALQEFLDLIYVSDQALQELIAYFEKQDEPTVILFFGDHQPNLDLSGYARQAGLSPVESQLTQYITPFFIWSNVIEIEPAYVEAISINYLAALLLDAAGLPQTAYHEWLLETAEAYPVTVLSGFADADGGFTAWGDRSSWPDRLKLMNQLRYNRLYDAENRLPALDLPAAAK